MIFGFDLVDEFSNIKLLEVLELNRKGEPSFGGNFIVEDKKKQRIIFEYSEKISMSLKYDDRLDMIVFDHLSPFEPIFRNNFRFYGPDGSYDGLRFEKGDFILEEDVDARNY